MTLTDALALGVTQGITEFFPVSSSAHLTIVHGLLNGQGDIFFDVLLHLATTIVVFIHFRAYIKQLHLSDVWLLILASIPAGCAGLLLKDSIEGYFASPVLVAGALFVTAGVNFFIAYCQSKQKNFTTDVRKNNAVVMGLAQVMAIFPGITRLGTTSLAGVFSGLSVFSAYRFSFLMMIPITMGATLLQILEVVENPELISTPLPSVVGAVSAVMVGLLSIRVFEAVVRYKKFAWLGWYSTIVAGLYLVLVAV